MPTIIDSLVVTLGLDPKNYKRGQQEARESLKSTREEAHRTATSMAADGAKAAEGFFGKLKNEALALGVVLFGGVGLAEFVKGTIDGNAAIGRFSANIGTTTEKLSAWESLAISVGGTAQDVATSLGNLSSVYQNFQIGKMPSADFIQALNLLNRETGSNISIEDFADPTVAALKLAGAASHLSKPRAKTLLGMLGQTDTMINLEEQGPEKLAEQLRNAVHLTQDQADAAEKAQAEIAKTTRAFKSLSNELITDVLPALNKIIGAIGTGLKGVHGASELSAHDAALPKATLAEIKARRRANALAWAKYFAFLGPRPNRPIWDSMEDDPGAASSAAATGEPAPTDRGAQAATRLQAAGFSGAQASGISAWLFSESGFNDRAFNPAGGGQGAFGIGQWRGDRQRLLKSRYGPNPTFAQQLEFLVWELGNTESGAGAGIKTQGTASGALLATAQMFGRGTAADNMSDYIRGMKYLGGGKGGAVKTSSSHVEIKQLNVNGVDTNKAAAVAAGIKPAIEGNFSTSTQANTGLF